MIVRVRVFTRWHTSKSATCNESRVCLLCLIYYDARRGYRLGAEVDQMPRYCRALIAQTWRVNSPVLLRDWGHTHSRRSWHHPTKATVDLRVMRCWFSSPTRESVLEGVSSTRKKNLRGHLNRLVRRKFIKIRIVDRNPSSCKERNTPKNRHKGKHAKY